MRMGGSWKGGLAAALLAAVASGCVSQSQYEAMTHKYYDERNQAQRLALENERLRGQSQHGEEIEELLKLIASGGLIQVEGGGVALPGDLGFGSGKHQLTDKGKKALDGLAEQIKSMKAFVRIDGHTDSDPIQKSPYSSNTHLSAMRAVAVADYLVSRGVPASHVYVVRGFGQNVPRGDNKTSRGKAANRRVEIFAFKSAPMSLPAAAAAPASSEDAPAPAIEK